MKFDGLFIFLLLAHPMNYEAFLNCLLLSNSNTMNLDGFHLFLLL
jgi:hypothetical protein